MIDSEPSTAVPATVTASVSARRLLARLRDVMAGSGAPQATLDKIVRLIAVEMGAEVCSCYVVRAGEVLELFSTVGLNPAAVHQTRLRLGEGLVGSVAANARPLAASDAASHPRFAYRPETGEEPFRSLLGVPILRGGVVRGVLVIQNVDRRHFSEDEVEILQTMAMIMAEVISRRDDAPDPSAGSAGVPADGGLLPVRLEGVSLNGGISEGLAVLHRPQLTVRQMFADDPGHEHERLERALRSMHTSIDALLAQTTDTHGGEPQEILEAYRMFAEDRGWIARIREAVDTGLTAEAAVRRVHDAMATRRAGLSDPYLRDRFHDFEDLANRMLLHLAGRGSVAGSGTLPDDVVVVARSMGPADLLDYDPVRLRALILEDGSPNSHVAIVARALDIPVVGRCSDALRRIESLDPVIVDAENSQVFVRPGDEAREAVSASIALRDRRRRSSAELARVPAVTRDGTRISLNVNAGLLLDMPHLDDTGADGIGLYRTEVPFMVRSSFPDVAEQAVLYGRVLDQAAGRPVIFRTLDVGGDKSLPYFAVSDERNPALGWRGVRIGLDRPAMLRKQLRALIQASQGRPLGVMFPMVAQVAEFEAARAILTAECAAAAERGVMPCEPLRVGVMVEVPSLLWQLPALLDRVDFVAVGSNDLAQYLFAADRGNPRVSQRYDTLSPAFLDALGGIGDACTAAGVPFSLCGEMAGRPLEALALLGLGYRSLSMSAGALGAVKTMARSVDLDQLSLFVQPLRRSPMRSIRPHLRAYAIDRGIPV